MNEKKIKNIAVVALIFGLLALSQSSAITNITMNFIAGSGINITQSGDNYTISSTVIGSNGSDNTKVNKSGDQMTGMLYINDKSVVLASSGLTGTLICSNLNNGSWCNLSSSLNISSGVVTFSGYNNTVPGGTDNTSVINISDGNIITVLNTSRNPNTLSAISFDNVSMLGRDLTSSRDGINTSNLVGSWRFDTNGSCIDSSGNGNNGTANGGMTCGNVSGKVNNGSYFNGVNNYVDAGNGTSLNITGDITLAAWVKRFGTTGNSQGIIGTRQGKTDATYPYQLGLDSTGNKFQLSATNGTIIISTGTTQSNLINNKWYYVVGTISNTSMNFYRDGVLVDTNTFIGSRQGNLLKLTIGSAQSTVRFFNGSIDEVHIYNRALNATEIRTNYYLRPDLIYEKTNSNSTEGIYNTTLATAANIPYATTDAAISNVTFRIPLTCIIGVNTIFDCVNTSYFNGTISEYIIGSILNNTVYVIPYGHPQSEVKTNNASTNIINISLNSNTSFQNIQFFSALAPFNISMFMNINASTDNTISNPMLAGKGNTFACIDNNGNIYNCDINKNPI
jgi:hypothetical protein